MPESGGVAFNVCLAGIAPTEGGGLVHAVTVIQPVQTWTVIRGQDDFKNVADSLSSVLPDLPACPQFEVTVESPVEILSNARNLLQHWFNSVLLYPGARESPVIRNFLTYNANIIPPQYESVRWTMFNASGQVVSQPVPEPERPPQAAGIDDMVMDDMFGAEEDGAPPPQENDSDDEDEFQASVRYQQYDEPITEEDEMDLAQMAGEVEMIEDVGSYVQDLGASHLGRSLMRQDELAGRTPTQPLPTHGHGGVQLGTAVNSNGHGGIGSAIEQAPPNLGGSFVETRPQSAPRLDAFKLIKVIGKGSFGKVFLVKEKLTGYMFALKVLKKDNIIKRNQVEHTKTERSVLGYVRHPFIVGMNMAFQSKDKLYFVLDYCAGGELFFHLGKVGRFPEDRARFYAAEITLAISYVHELGIIYRDLKPENVLLDAAGHIRLTDFGLSKEGINSSSSGAYSFCGTPEYLSPEILDRKGHGRAVDWWSLGALLYEMLTGLPPFYCQDRERLFEKIRKSELHYPSSLSPLAEGFLKGLLTKDPDKRLGSGDGGVEDIKGHAFFKTIEWDRLQRGEIAAPWVPPISSTSDTSQFDTDFTSMPVFSPQSMQRAPGFGATPGRDNPFEGFTFQNPSVMGRLGG